MNLRRLLPALLVTLMAIGLMALPSSAAPSNPSNDFPRMPRECATPKEKIPQKAVICEINAFDDTRPTIVLWGDSHAWMFLPALKQEISGRNINLVALVMGTCPPVDENLTPAERERAQACKRNNVNGLDVAKVLARGDQPFRFVLGASWQRYYNRIQKGDRKSYLGETAYRMKTGTPRLMRTLTRMGADVDVIGQVATVPAITANCRRGNDPYACDVKRRKALKQESGVKRWLLDMMAPLPGDPQPINVNRAYCTSSACSGLTDGVRTWFDDLHLSASNSKRLAPFFTDTVNAVRPASTTSSTSGSGGDSLVCQLLTLC